MFWRTRNLLRWLPGGKRPRLLGGGRARKRKRGGLDFGPGRNAIIRLGCYGTALFLVFLLLIVKLVTGQ